MIAKPVEWVLVVHYGPEAHRATYGRQVRSDRYTKDYIQLSRKREFLDAVAKLFSVTGGTASSVPLTYQWPAGTASGAFIFRSSDRPHLKWGTSSGAPQVWKMTSSPTDVTPETIPGDPSKLDFQEAENEFTLLASRGAGQPYLLAIKLRDEPRTLHLRAYLRKPSEDYQWANIELAPQEIQALAAKTSQNSALAWSLFQSGGVPSNVRVDEALSQIAASDQPHNVIESLDAGSGIALASYLKHPGYGLFFDPSKNHDAWLQATPLPAEVTGSVEELLQALEAHFPESLQDDATAETLDTNPEEVKAFSEKIAQKNYAVPDSTRTAKTRGSAQKAFSNAVKDNYGFKCAITGIATKDFLIAAHIVPWSKDESIRLDPSNGICLSLLVDKAFENGYLQINDDYTISIDARKCGDDQVLRRQLEPYNGKTLKLPFKERPRQEYLRRRRDLLADTS